MGYCSVISSKASVNFISRFLSLKQQGVEIRWALDIGAYRGQFTNILRSVWPECQVQQFEADERQKSYIPDAKFVLLGDKKRKVIFYTLPEGACTTGSSIFRENTIFYQDPIMLTKYMTTLDAVVDYLGDWSKGLVKIDTQGSELLILKGAKRFLAKRPRFILLECSVQEYNIGAPLVTDVIYQMLKYGYKVYDVFGLFYGECDRLIQTDVLFEVMV